MAIKTRQVTVELFESDGSPLEGAIIHIQLMNTGRLARSAIAPSFFEDLTDQEGKAVFTLWQNNLSTVPTHYTITAWHPTLGIPIYLNERFCVGSKDASISELLSVDACDEPLEIPEPLALGALTLSPSAFGFHATWNALNTEDLIGFELGYIPADDAINNAGVLNWQFQDIASDLRSLDTLERLMPNVEYLVYLRAVDRDGIYTQPLVSAVIPADNNIIPVVTSATWAGGVVNRGRLTVTLDLDDQYDLVELKADHVLGSTTTAISRDAFVPNGDNFDVVVNLLPDEVYNLSAVGVVLSDGVEISRSSASNLFTTQVLEALTLLDAQWVPDSDAVTITALRLSQPNVEFVEIATREAGQTAWQLMGIYPVTEIVAGAAAGEWLITGTGFDQSIDREFRGRGIIVNNQFIGDYGDEIALDGVALEGLWVPEWQFINRYMSSSASFANNSAGAPLSPKANIAANSNGVFIGSINGLSVSFDRGITWNNVKPNNVTKKIKAVAINSNGVMLAGVDQTVSNEFYFSADGGITWSVSSSFNSLGFGVLAATGAGAWFFIGLSNGDIYSYQWQQWGKCFTYSDHPAIAPSVIENIVYGKGQTTLLIYGKSVFITRNDGISFTEIQVNLNGSTLNSSAMGLHYLDARFDGGSTWVILVNQNSGEAFASQSNDVNGFYIIRSTDDGLTWFADYVEAGLVYPRAMECLGNGIWHIGCRSGLRVMSYDNGQSWNYEMPRDLVYNNDKYPNLGYSISGMLQSAQYIPPVWHPDQTRRMVASFGGPAVAISPPVNRSNLNDGVNLLYLPLTTKNVNNNTPDFGFQPNGKCLVVSDSMLLSGIKTHYLHSKNLAESFINLGGRPCYGVPSNVGASDITLFDGVVMGVYLPAKRAIELDYEYTYEFEVFFDDSLVSSAFPFNLDWRVGFNTGGYGFISITSDGFLCWMRNTGDVVEAIATTKMPKQAWVSVAVCCSVDAFGFSHLQVWQNGQRVINRMLPFIPSLQGLPSTYFDDLYLYNVNSSQSVTKYKATHPIINGAQSFSIIFGDSYRKGAIVGFRKLRITNGPIRPYKYEFDNDIQTKADIEYDGPYVITGA